MSAIEIGLKQTETMRVQARHTIPQIGPAWQGFVDTPDVLATAMMIGFIEQTCALAVRPFLQEGHKTVGIHADFSHVSATPVGMRITACIELVGTGRNALTFRIPTARLRGRIGIGISCPSRKASRKG